jgi:hypothetical protein
MTSIVETLLEVKLREDEDFLKIKETLTRVGVASRKEKKLYQSCHILHKRGLYYIVHFKELFLLDGKESDFTDDDRARRNTIAYLLEEWGLVTVVDSAKFQDLRAPMNLIKILPHRDKADWILESKYTVGKKR